MMKDYTSTYGGKFASTADFQKVVERHMVPAMNATGDGKMDWFFNQWVYGTEVPALRGGPESGAGGGGDPHPRHASARRGSRKDFRALVPIYVEFGKNETARVGHGADDRRGERAGRREAQAAQKRAQGVLLNAHGEVLARD